MSNTQVEVQIKSFSVDLENNTIDITCLVNDKQKDFIFSSTSDSCVGPINQVIGALTAMITVKILRDFKSKINNNFDTK